MVSVSCLTTENYERLEADKKKHVDKKRRLDGPAIRYHSVLMPIVSDTHLKEENVDVEGYGAPPSNPEPHVHHTVPCQSFQTALSMTWECPKGWSLGRSHLLFV